MKPEYCILFAPLASRLLLWSTLLVFSCDRIIRIDLSLQLGLLWIMFSPLDNLQLSIFLWSGKWTCQWTDVPCPSYLSLNLMGFEITQWVYMLLSYAGFWSWSRGSLIDLLLDSTLKWFVAFIISLLKKIVWNIVLYLKSRCSDLSRWIYLGEDRFLCHLTSCMCVCRTSAPRQNDWMKQVMLLSF